MKKQKLKDELKWVRDGLEGRVLEQRVLNFVFSYEGAIDSHYQITTTCKHNATRLTPAAVERLQEVRAEFEMWVEASGNTKVGRYFTLWGAGDSLEENFQVAQAVIERVYELELEDLTAVERGQLPPVVHKSNELE